MTVLLGLVGVLLLGKIVWNLAIPYVLFRRLRRTNEPTTGISLALAIEWLLLIVSICISTVARVETWGPASVAILGGGAIVASYVHLVLVAFVLGWIASKQSPV